MDKDIFKQVPKKYRPIPFWSWNDKLDIKETMWQIDLMDQAGIGGFFMHARGGLKTEYMGNEWFDNVTTAINSALKRGMFPFAYDENGWPSGFGNGKVNGLGVQYQQKYLRMSDKPKNNGCDICQSGEHYFYYEINPFYIDVLDKNVIKKFIEIAYEPYYKKYGNLFQGFFTDEPQISRNGIPWSFVFEKEYRTRYNDNLYEHLPELFLEKNAYKSTRIKFWEMVTELFCESYTKQIFQWCDERGLKFTGHLLEEESLESQLITNGAVMPHYEYFHIPGMDWLGRRIFDCLTPKQLGSVAQQMGKKTVLSETFALCGHNVSFAELKGIYEWQMVRGVNLLCQHLEGYSLRGIRKRDYPPAMYYQQPWWEEYEKFNTAMSRIGKALSDGEECADVLLVHPQSTAWSLFDNGKNKGLKELDKRLLSAIAKLERKHIVFHLGDETLIRRHGKVENGKFVIGNRTYSRVITECCDVLLPHTEKLICEFKRAGGKIVSVDETETNNIVDREDITYTVRYYDDFTLHYFVNTSPDRKTARINAKGFAVDIYTGELCPFNPDYSFEPWGSLLVIEDKAAPCVAEEDAEYIKLDGEFEILNSTDNCLTLDYCDYYFDGILQEKNGYVLDIGERASTFRKEIAIHQDYKVKINYIPRELYLVCETPEAFAIKVNGETISKEVKGYFADKSFKKIDISKYVKLGENIISFDCDFAQSDSFYDNLSKAYAFACEKSKFAYDMEIEAIYLVGDFSVKTTGDWEDLDRNALRYTGNFEIDEPVKRISLKDIQKQGFPFFTGKITLSGKISCNTDNPILCLHRTGINCIKIKIGEVEKTVLTNDQVRIDIKKGSHKVEITLINTLRNMLGPHHMKLGESFEVTPGSFYKLDCIWEDWGSGKWSDDYCFVKMGLLDI